MKIAIEISNKDIPKHQEIIDIRLHFIDGHVVEADGYGFEELPKGHGRLKDTDALLEKQYRIDNSATLSTRDVINAEDVEDALTIIEADKED